MICVEHQRLSRAVSKLDRKARERALTYATSIHVAFFKSDRCRVYIHRLINHIACVPDSYPPPRLRLDYRNLRKG